ncbi:MAG: nucleotidyl transferase AbiEii/AbiGii toxin family protein [Chloroflexi bacterium]|nr:nucleotidyl transferase AbiEii/AbiGii toxin family protein [Chloroflexota bacterium]
MTSHERLSTLIEKTGFWGQALEKVLRLLEVLADLNRHPLLSRVLVLKGGTALHLGFGAPRRLSVDLDFNYTGALDRQEMEQDRSGVEAAVERIAKAQGYQVQWSPPAHAGRKCFLNYRNLAGSPDRIEVDLNFLHRQLLLPATTRTMWSPDPLAAVSASIISLPELCAGKLCALLDRLAPRDVFDVGCLPDLAPGVLTSPSFRALFIAMSGALPHPLHSYLGRSATRLTPQQVRDQLHPMLLQGQEPSAMDLEQAAWPLIEPLLHLSSAEQEYVDRLQRGELLPELLFPDDLELAERVRRHPVLLWKAQNAAARP